MTTRQRRDGLKTRFAAATLLLTLILLCPADTRAQWTTSGTNTTTTNNVGVGTTSPANIFHVRPAANVNMGFTHTNGVEAIITAFNDANTAAVPLVLRGASVRFQDGTLTERFRVSSGVAVGSGYVGTAPPADGAIFQGNVGLGTTSPGQLNGFNQSAYVPLHIQGTSARYIVIDSATSNSGLALNDNSQPVNGRLWTMTQAAGGGKLTFSSTTDDGTPTTRMVIDRAGSVGIGMAAPAHRLDVAGNVNASGLCLGGTCKTSWADISGTAVSSQWTTSGTSIHYTGGNVGIGPGMTAPGEALMVNGKVSINRASSPGPAEFRVFNGGNVAEWSFRQASSASHNLNISKSASGVYTDYMTIDTAGNVGVGTTAPASKLHVGGGTPAGSALPGLNVALGGNSYVAASNGTVNTFLGSDSSPYGIVGTLTNHPLGLRANNALAMTLMPDGKVGVGTSSPAQRLDVAGNVNASGLCLEGTCKTTWAEISGSGGANQWTASGSNIHFSAGNVGVGTATPGARLDVGAGAAARGGYSDMLIGAGGNNPQLEFYGPTKSSAISHDEAGGGLVFYTNGPAFATNFFVGNNGNVGVGTTAPARRLHVLGGSVESQFSATAGHGYGFYIARDNNHFVENAYYDGTEWKAIKAGKAAIIQTYTAGGYALYLQADNTSRAADAARTFVSPFVVKMDGKVGVGTLNPGHLLDVAGNVNASGLCLGGDCKTSWAAVVGAGAGSGWADGGATVSLSNSSANVGVGTSTPRGKLEVAGGPLFLGDMGQAAWGNMVMRGRVISASNNIHLSPPGGTGVYIDSGFREAGGATGPVNLHVSGDVIAGGNISAKYQDVAEWVPSTQKLAAGTVVVLDSGRTNHVLASGTAYDTKVAGVVSEQPGVILGVGGEGKLMVATTGRVKVRVDASRGAIKVGDLLVTSGAEGVAMKSVPVDLSGVQFHRPGTIIGKALEPLEKGTGEILVLLSLQ